MIRYANLLDGVVVAGNETARVKHRSIIDMSRNAGTNATSATQAAMFNATMVGASQHKIKGHFQAWTEKGNQVDQQLSAVLRTMKDIRRIGVGGSDLGSS